MASKKESTDRHKPSRTVRLPEPLARVLKELAGEEFTSMTELAKVAVREYLERRDRWPRRAK